MEKSGDKFTSVAVGVIGCWHQGVVGAACLAGLGYEVLGADLDAERVAFLNRGKAPLYEPGLDDLLKKGVESGKLRFTTDIPSAVKGRDYVLIMFDTPVDENDRSDLTCVLDAARAIAPHVKKGAVVLVTAQVPVGTCDHIADLLRKGGADCAVAYSPENLRLGQAIERFLHPALPVIGSDSPEALDHLEKLFAPLQVRWERVNLRTAEMTKHALNAFLATSICFANELGTLCDEVGADGHRLAQVLRMEPRIGSKALLFPGLGFSGGTLARDMQTLRGLGDGHNIDTLLLDGAWASNQQQNRSVVRCLRGILGPLKGRVIAVLGLTYKPDTSTLRRSASLEIIRDLVAEGAAVTGHDPKADRAEVAAHTEFRFCESALEAAAGAEALVLMTPWKEYRDLDFASLKKRMARPLLFDTANLLDADALMRMGFDYVDIGRGRKAGPPGAFSTENRGGRQR